MLSREEGWRLYLEKLEFEANYFKSDDSEDDDICTCPACMDSYQALYADYIQKADKLTRQKLQQDPSTDKYYCSIM